MTTQERKITCSLAAIYAFRMLGLFMILPIFSLYASHFQHATPFLIGLCLGVYGLTQGILQIPFGLLSDYFGRKPLIIIGLLLFTAGSIVAALANSIDGMIAGRALQGAGAVGSVLTALLADSTADENRLKAMSMIGITIGFSFVVGILLGPVLSNMIKLAGIFWLTACLGLLGILILLVFVPTPKTLLMHQDSEPVLSQFKNIFKKTELLRLDFGIFTLHAMLMAFFVVVPVLLLHDAGMSAERQWMVYLPALIIACILMVPGVIIAESKRKMKEMLLLAVAVLTISQFALALFERRVFMIGIILCFFFTAFTLLEGILPSLVSKIAPAGGKGTAMGIYSSSQFLGIFFGGSVAGLILNHYTINAVFVFAGMMGLIWLIVAASMKRPLHLSSKIIKIEVASLQDAQALRLKLLEKPGVHDAFIALQEQVAYLKVDRQKLDDKAFADL